MQTNNEIYKNITKKLGFNAEVKKESPYTVGRGILLTSNTGFLCISQWFPYASFPRYS